MKDGFEKPGNLSEWFGKRHSVASGSNYEDVDDLPIPYGTEDLDAQVQVNAGPPFRVRCYHRGCDHWLRRPTEHCPGDLCPRHRILCHYSNGSPTYSYHDIRRNAIVGADLLARRIVGHPFKHDSSKLRMEKSEDALTWNVFRSLAESKVLHAVAAWLTGIVCPEEPRLYLWGLRIDDDSVEPWELLISARERFERGLPADRPRTEPDIALYLPGRYLVLIEAKFTSPNPFCAISPRQEGHAGPRRELIDIYTDPALVILDPDKARDAGRIPSQLWRNMAFAEWMALAEESGARPYLASLTRLGYEEQSCAEFRELLHPGFAGRFVRRTWEEIDDLWAARLPELSRSHQYLKSKTVGLLPAFRL